MGRSPTPRDVLRYADRASMPVPEDTLEAFADQFDQQDEILTALDN